VPPDAKGVQHLFTLGTINDLLTIKGLEKAQSIAPHEWHARG